MAWQVAQHRCVGNCDTQEDVPRYKLWADLGGPEVDRHRPARGVAGD